jgi:hypothetical protein
MKKDEETKQYDHWDDVYFLKELRSRIEDFENGTDKGLSWEEVKMNARNQFKDSVQQR